MPTKTGVKPTPEELAEIRALYRKSTETPVIRAGSTDLAAVAWDTFNRRFREILTRYGLETSGEYGIDADEDFIRR